MIGRKRERAELQHWVESGRPEFVVVYGRRRIGKTYLVRRFFRDQFAFRATGIDDESMGVQLSMFHERLREHGDDTSSKPTSWFEAFGRLKALLSSDSAQRDPATGRLVVFIDEMPWLDTPKSQFKQALEYFWNDWGCMQDDLLLIACGSATSWLTKNLLRSAEGFYGRVTGTLSIQPFTLRESEELMRFNGVAWTRQQIIEYRLVFGGVPYYLNLARNGYSPAQNVDLLCFAKGGQLEHEFDVLFASLFKHPENYKAVVRALGMSKGGLTNAELRKVRGLPQATALTKVLEDLVLCGFVRRDEAAGKTYGARYRLADAYCAFYLQFLERKRFDSWASHAATPGYYAWRGNAFERVCWEHVPQIKAALGIQGVEVSSAPWTSTKSEPRAQIDLVLDRRDGIVDLCEAKLTDAAYELDKDGYEALVTKRDVYQRETKSRKALHLVLVSASGVKRNAYAQQVQAIVDGDALFA